MRITDSVAHDGPSTLAASRKTASITLRLSQTECAQLQKRAADAGLTLSATCAPAFLRWKLCGPRSTTLSSNYAPAVTPSLKLRPCLHTPSRFHAVGLHVCSPFAVAPAHRGALQPLPPVPMNREAFENCEAFEIGHAQLTTGLQTRDAPLRFLGPLFPALYSASSTRHFRYSVSGRFRITGWSGAAPRRSSSRTRLRASAAAAATAPSKSAQLT